MNSIILKLNAASPVYKKRVEPLTAKYSMKVAIVPARNNMLSIYLILFIVSTAIIVLLIISPSTAAEVYL